MRNNNQLFENDREVLFELACITAWSESKSGFKRFLKTVKSVARVCLTKYELCGEQHKWMFMDTVPRKDHRYFFELVKEQCTYDKGEFTWIKSRTINLRGFCDLFRYLVKFGNLKNFEVPAISDNPNNFKYIPETFSEHVMLYVDLIDNLQMKYAMEKYDWSGIEKLVTLYDIGKPEHFAVIKANEMGCKTVVLSHGCMWPFFDCREFPTFNMYKIPSRYLLALGSNIIEPSKRLMSDPEIIICGQLMIDEQEYNPQENVLAIVCDIHAHMYENTAMINIAQRYAKENGMQVYIRLHPGDRESNYIIDRDVCRFERNLDNAGVIIAYTSSMIFLYMAQGKRVMRYVGSQHFYSMPDSILFDDYEEFADKVKNIKDMNFKELITDYIDCIGKESAEKYRKAFEYIESK